ncbi:hypothetical protein [Microbispora amethystogenes]|nr:hypothetical protein [Microbispora amethystogenes]
MALVVPVVPLLAWISVLAVPAVPGLIARTVLMPPPVGAYAASRAVAGVGNWSTAREEAACARVPDGGPADGRADGCAVGCADGRVVGCAEGRGDGVGQVA